MPVGQLVAALQRVPRFHLEGLREIVYLPEFAPFAGGYFAGNAKGEFQQEERRIYVYAFDDRPMLLHVLFHEIGHAVFFLAISSRVKKRWVTEVSAASAYPTAYAETNAREDFAETYACYLLQPRALEADCPEKHAFMRDCVFSGRAETLKEMVRGR